MPNPSANDVERESVTIVCFGTSLIGDGSVLSVSMQVSIGV